MESDNKADHAAPAAPDMVATAPIELREELNAKRLLAMETKMASITKELSDLKQQQQQQQQELEHYRALSKKSSAALEQAKQTVCKSSEKVVALTTRVRQQDQALLVSANNNRQKIKSLEQQLAKKRKELEKLHTFHNNNMAAKIKECERLRALYDNELEGVKQANAHRLLSEQQRKEEMLCGVCLDQEKNTVLVCGHVFCAECAVRPALCPICRAVNVVAQCRRLFM